MTDLHAFAAHLRSVDVGAACATTMSRAGGNMMRRAQELAPAGPHIPRYADSISFERDGNLAVECFARDRGQGPLAGILEFGHGPNAPRPHFIPALEEEAERAPQWLAKAIADAL